MDDSAPLPGTEKAYSTLLQEEGCRLPFLAHSFPCGSPRVSRGSQKGQTVNPLKSLRVVLAKKKIPTCQNRRIYFPSTRINNQPREGPPVAIESLAGRAGKWWYLLVRTSVVVWLNHLSRFGMGNRVIRKVLAIRGARKVSFSIIGHQSCKMWEWKFNKTK